VFKKLPDLRVGEDLISVHYFDNDGLILIQANRIRLNASKASSGEVKLLTNSIFKPKPHLTLYSPYYVKACNEFAVPNSAS